MFRATSRDPEHFKKESYRARNLTQFDHYIRGPIFGYKGSSRLYRHISCD